MKVGGVCLLIEHASTKRGNLKNQNQTFQLQREEPYILW